MNYKTCEPTRLTHVIVSHINRLKYEREYYEKNTKETSEASIINLMKHSLAIIKDDVFL